MRRLRDAKAYNSGIQIETIPNSAILATMPVHADVVRSVDPVIRHEFCRNLAQNAVTQPVHDSSNILIMNQAL